MADSEVLFTITKEHLDTGLRGFPVGTCPNSHVDPMKGLFYGGYAIPELADRQPGGGHLPPHQARAAGRGPAGGLQEGAGGPIPSCIRA